MTGIDPLSIDQTLFRPIEPQREYSTYRELVYRFSITEPTVFLSRHNGAAWSLEPDFYDISVVLPTARRHILDRPDWLTMNGEREAVAVDLDIRAAHLPAVLQAHYAGESADAVPADRVLIEQTASQAVLFLRPGNYRIALLDANGRSLNERHLQVTVSTATH